MVLKYFLAVGLLLVEGLLGEHVEDCHAQTKYLCFFWAHGGKVAQRGGSLDGRGALGRPIILSEGIELLFLVDADRREMRGGLDNCLALFDKIALLYLIWALLFMEMGHLPLPNFEIPFLANFDGHRRKQRFLAAAADHKLGSFSNGINKQYEIFFLI